MKVQNDIATALDKNLAVVLVMPDLSAAFDTIDQNMLLQLMSSKYGILDRALSWFRSSTD